MRSRIRTAVAIVATTTVALGVAACAPQSPGEESESSLTVAVDWLNVNYDPWQAGAFTWASFNMQGVYETLWSHDESIDGYVPVLATDWTLADDRKSLSIRLRDDVDFIDGVHFDAEGLATFLNEIFTNENTVGYYDFSGYTPVATAIGEYEIEITTELPMFRLFFHQMAYTGIASPAGVGDPDYFVEGAVGSGPYLVDETVPEVSMTLVRNPEYRDPDAFPYDRVVLQAYSDNVAALNALKTGQIDATRLDTTNGPEVENASGMSLHRGAGEQIALVLGDWQGTINPALADVRVRQAIQFAFDRETIDETINHGFGSTNSQAYVPRQLEYIEGEDDRYAYDPDRARELLAEAGYADGLVLQIASPADAKDIEPLVVQSLGDVGITVELVAFTGDEYEAFFSRLAEGEFPTALLPLFLFNVTRNLYSTAPSSGEFRFWPIAEDLTEYVDTMQFGAEDESVEAGQDLGRFVLDEALIVTVSRPDALWASSSDVDVEVGGIIGVPRLWNFSPAS
jgi:peptide/nickel transport system substrate-binding protein